MTKEELVQEIKIAFKNVVLDDGVGLWEGQGIDDYADHKTMLELRKKDETYRNNWDEIPYEDLNRCESSLSFFDAKGMRFHLPKFLIFETLEEEILEEYGFSSAGDMIFRLGYKLNEEYQKERFSLLNNPQIQCVIHFLQYRVDQIIARHTEYSIQYGSSMATLDSDADYVNLQCTINQWKQKLTVIV